MRGDRVTGERQGSPNRWWADEAVFQFHYDGRDLKYFDVVLKWGKTISVDLDTGKLQPPVDTARR